MAILVMAHDPNGSPKEAARWESLVGDKVRSAPGFIFHATYAVDGGYQIVNSWETREDFQNFYEKEIKPNMRGDAPGSPPQIFELATLSVRG